MTITNIQQLRRKLCVFMRVFNVRVSHITVILPLTLLMAGQCITLRL